ncbi:MAG: resolvase [Campylobacter sp.]|nr:resolvase [Campylobacter sp.]
MIGVGMVGKSSVEYLVEILDLKKIREFCKFDDENAKFLLSGYISNLLYGTRYIAKKRIAVHLAKKLIQKGSKKSQILKLTKISERTYFRLKKEQENG